jgi:hypothetical protein
VDYPVARCESFTTTVGVENDNPPGPVDMSVAPAPGSPGHVGPSFGSPTSSQSLVRVRVLRLSGTTTGGAQGVFGTPSALCPF